MTDALALLLAMETGDLEGKAGMPGHGKSGRLVRAQNAPGRVQGPYRAGAGYGGHLRVRLAKAVESGSATRPSAERLGSDERLPAGESKCSLRPAAPGDARRRHGLRAYPIIKPWPLRPVLDGGFTLHDFIMDEADATVTCLNQANPDDQPQTQRHLRCRLRRLSAQAPVHEDKDGESLASNPRDRLQREPGRETTSGPPDQGLFSALPDLPRTGRCRPRHCLDARIWCVGLCDRCWFKVFFVIPQDGMFSDEKLFKTASRIR